MGKRTEALFRPSAFAFSGCWLCILGNISTEYILPNFPGSGRRSIVGSVPLLSAPWMKSMTSITAGLSRRIGGSFDFPAARSRDIHYTQEYYSQ
jgi:hypothetical protein